MTTVETYIDSLPADQQGITNALVSLIEATLPGVGAVWHGHPVWSLGGAPGKSPVCFFKAYSLHVTFGFWRGQDLGDTSGRLQSGSRVMASVKLRTVDDIDTELFRTWLQNARELETSTGQ